MRRIIFAISICIFSALMAEVKVEKVLETTSIKEYNQWVKRNKAKYPGLKPYFLKVECIKWGKEWKIIYYNEDDDLEKEEVVKAKPGWWLYVRDYSKWGRVMLVENDSSLGESSPVMHTIKNEKGEQMFSFEWGYDYITDAGVYILPNGAGIFRSRAQENYAELLTWDGRKIGRIDSIFSFSINSVATRDKRYILLDAGGVAVFIEGGKALWRKSPAGNMTLAENGQYIAIGSNNGEYIGSITVYNHNGAELYSYTFSSKSRGNPTAKFSSDSRYLVASFDGEYVLINNITGQRIWQKLCEGSIVSFVKNDEHFITANKEIQKIYIYDTLGNLEETLNVSYGGDIKKKRTKEGEIIESKVLYYRWSCQVFDDLIITNSGREWHPIIFKIE